MTRRKPRSSSSRHLPPSPATDKAAPPVQPGKRSGRQPPSSGAKTVSGEGLESWLFGRHAVLAALANPERMFRRIVLAADSREETEAALRACIAARPDGPPPPAPERLPREDLQHLLPPGAVHQGMAALAAPLPEPDIETLLNDLAQCPSAVLVILDQVTDPQNVGAILRSASAFGADGVIMTDRHAPPPSGALAKAASGGLEHVPLCRVVNLVRTLEHLKQAGFWLAGLDGAAETNLAGAGLSGRIGLVLGAEGAGLRRLTREHCDYLVRLPMHPRMESLNVSAAAAVALYELVRERPEPENRARK